MDQLIDQVLNSILHAVIWRGTWHLDGMTLLVLGIAVFIIMMIRKRR
ncbi:MAG: hypothetical protein V3V09_00745 [Arenicellales bacterium]